MTGDPAAPHSKLAPENPPFGVFPGWKGFAASAADSGGATAAPPPPRAVSLAHRSSQLRAGSSLMGSMMGGGGSILTVGRLSMLAVPDGAAPPPPRAVSPAQCSSLLMGPGSLGSGGSIPNMDLRILLSTGGAARFHSTPLSELPKGPHKKATLRPVALDGEQGDGFGALVEWVRLHWRWPALSKSADRTEKSHAVFLRGLRYTRRHFKGQLSPADLLSPERVALMEALGVEIGVPMSWNPQEEKYQARFKAVAAWVRMHGRWPTRTEGLKVSASVEQLHVVWIGNQRKSKRKGDLSPARTGQLESLGEETGVTMSWDPHEDEYQAGFASLEAWVLEHGRWPKHGEPNGDWLNNRRAEASLTEGRPPLSPARISQMDGLAEKVGIPRRPSTPKAAVLSSA